MRRGVEAGKGHHSKNTQSNLMVATFSKEVLSAYLCLSFPFLSFFSFKNVSVVRKVSH